MDSRISWECASVLGFKRWRSIVKVLCVSALVFLLGFSPWWSQSSLAAKKGRSEPKLAKTVGKIAETAPPRAIEELRQELEDFQPQVSILSPKPNEVLSEDTVAVTLQVKDLPTFKDKKLGLGPHLHVLLDNSQYQAVYDQSQPLLLEHLSPGTHTIRAFASRPWHESFKNDGAYAQVTFHVFAKTQENSPDPKLPLLTYSRPQGSYGAEPIMLDFYLTNAPLHLVAQENDTDDIADWRIRATVNGESFVIDRWQPLYLKGFKPGKNWVQLEFLDEKGNLVQNTFNNTARLITYEPNGKDTLSKLVRGDLTAQQARGIVDPNFVPAEPVVTPAPKPTPTPKPSPTPEASPTPKPSPAPEASPSPQPSPTPKASPTLKSNPKANPTPKASPTPSPVPVQPAPAASPAPQPIVTPIPTRPTPSPVALPVPEPKPQTPGFFNRFRQTFGKQLGDQPTIAPEQTSPPAAPAKPSPEIVPEKSAPVSKLTPAVPESSLQRSPIPQQLQAPEPSEKVLEAGDAETAAVGTP